MAYQSLNIIGSFMAGIPEINRSIGEERGRADAYRSLLQSQVSRINRESAEDVSDVETNDRMMVGDSPHERRNPYLSLRRRRPAEQESEPEPPQAEEGALGGRLDVIV